jgi:hypothetical protein
MVLLVSQTGCGDGRQDRTGLPEQVLVVGVEAMSWERIDPLLQRGELPHLRRLIGEGTRGTLRAPDPLEPAQLWTTALTGKRPPKHRILSDLTSLPDGTRGLVPSTARRAQSVWQIFGDYGVGVGAIGFPGSWPAEVVNGFLVASGYVRNRWTETAEHSYRRQRGQLDTYPPHLYPEIRPLIHGLDDLRREDASRFFVLNEEEFRMLYDEPLGSIFMRTNPLRDFGLTHQADRSNVDVARHLQERYDLRVVGVHLELLDALQPVYWYFSYPELYRTPPENQRRLAKTVDEGYRWIDEQIGRLLERLPDRTTVIVLSDCGFSNAIDPRTLGTDEERSLPQRTREAVVVLSGHGIRRGHRLSHPGSLADLTPTLLALFAAPVGQDMDGQVLIEAFEPAFLDAHPIRVVTSHDQQWNQDTRYPYSLAEMDSLLRTQR